MPSTYMKENCIFPDNFLILLSHNYAATYGNDK